MYFDLEFARGCNLGLDGEELVRAWINVVAGKGMGELQKKSAFFVLVRHGQQHDASSHCRFAVARRHRQ